MQRSRDSINVCPDWQEPNTQWMWELSKAVYRDYIKKHGKDPFESKPVNMEDWNKAEKVKV